MLAGTLDERVDELVSIKEEILRAVSTLDDCRLRTILVCRYTRFMRWEEIAIEMHYGIRRIMVLHDKALQSLAEKSVH